MWIARDKNGELYLYMGKPIKDQLCWVSNEKFMFINDEDFTSEFEEVKWEDEEPTKLILKK